MSQTLSKEQLEVLELFAGDAETKDRARNLLETRGLDFFKKANLHGVNLSRAVLRKVSFLFFFFICAICEV